MVDNLDIPVLCYGLLTDFRGELFCRSQYLLAWADKLVELKTVCHCGRKAGMVLRLDSEGRPFSEGEQVVIGGNERYISVCRQAFFAFLSVFTVFTGCAAIACAASVKGSTYSRP